MVKYTLRRLAYLLPVLIGVTFVVFSIMYFTPGDAAAMRLGQEATQEQIDSMRDQMGLNDPFHIQYGRYIINAVQGDFGRSWRSNSPVISEILARFPNTFVLSVAGMSIAILIGVSLGVVSAVKQYSISDNIGMFFALFGVSVPNFWFGMLTILLFSVFWNNQFGFSLFPSSGFDAGLRSLVLPALTLGTSSAAIITRMTRSAMLEVLSQDYIRFTRAKGLGERKIITRHALSNALIPIITVTGLQFGVLLGGAVFTETVFSFPGIGRLIVESIRARDLPMVQGSVIFLAFVFSLVNLGVDLIYALVDPRIKAQYK
ncbi:binding-protein-dependent transport systems inner membrane component [Alkaliphilus metalliredigens QYMF]|uniref:Binding-protein-dependent transport systems inner membrane component n=1 Tax=Alkaliphilus metalliredigens (strain QYMF) TaxID=293826 RepID=A6TPC4_ALKMQ|nr:ABC transporter permease [Alkaliphilus metalliredigens]ABR48042.1 binding-protein-dependent transport systems inner membrane component [Alkaliphilus metalliredigens QYMF]